MSPRAVVFKSSGATTDTSRRNIDSTRFRMIRLRPRQVPGVLYGGSNITDRNAIAMTNP